MERVAVELRQHQRFIKELEFEFKYEDDWYSVMTVDISMGGIRVAEPMPGHSSSRFRATLVDARGRPIELVCKVLKDRTRLTIERVANVDLLRTCLLR